MLYLMRIMIVLAVLVGLGYAGLYALGHFVEPEAREISVTIPTPKPRLILP